MKYGEVVVNVLREKGLIYADGSKPCSMCGEETHYIDFCSEQRICSEECMCKQNKMFV